MNNILWFIAGTFFGATSGVFVLALLSASRLNDYTEEGTGGETYAGNDSRGND